MPGAVILDFDGTLVDSMALGVACVNQVLAGMGRPMLSDGQVASLRRSTFRAALDTLGIPLWRVPGMALQVRRLMREREGEIRPVPGVQEAVQRLAAAGHPLAVLTNNDPGLVREVLARHRFPALADIRTGHPLLGKASALKALLRAQRWAAAGSVYVSDEHRDAAASRDAGLAMIAVTWGVNDAALLAQAGCAACIDRPEELPAAVERLIAG